MYKEGTVTLLLGNCVEGVSDTLINVLCIGWEVVAEKKGCCMEC